LKKILVYITILFWLGSPLQDSYAQDFHLSQYDASPLFLNPSMTGMFNGYYRIHGHYRNQWSSVASPFTTSSLSFDMPYKKVGLGAIILNDRAGVGNYNVLNFVLSLGYDYAIDSAKYHHIAGGLQAGIIHKSVNMDKLIFHNQYTGTNSGGFDPGLPSEEILENTSILLPEVAAGLMYYYANDKSLINPFIGFSAFHLTSPNETFYGNTNKLPMRFVTHLGTKINITPVVQLTPKILLMNQGNANETTISFVVNYYLTAQDAWVFGGPTYRTFKFEDFNKSDAVIILLGLKYGKFTYRVSYDFNTSTLSSISKGRGGFELSITYIASKVNIPKPMCPRL